MSFLRRPIIVKCGTEALYATPMATSEAWPYAAQDAFGQVAAQVAFVEKSGVPVVIVSSGAVREEQRSRRSYSFVSRLTSGERAGIVAVAGVEGDTIRRFVKGDHVGTMIGDSVQFY